jgi:hypothetical protein
MRRHQHEFTKSRGNAGILEMNSRTAELYTGLGDLYHMVFVFRGARDFANDTKKFGGCRTVEPLTQAGGGRGELAR